MHTTASNALKSAEPASPSARLQRKCSCESSGETCSRCGTKQQSLQRKAIGTPAGTNIAPIGGSVLGLPGTATESLLEHDYSNVRLNNDSQANTLAREVDAVVHAGGKREGSTKNKGGLQRKLAVGASNDPLEQEADRVADQVLAAPADSPPIAPPNIRRCVAPMNGGSDTAPASVDGVLANPGSPLEPVLRHDMERRFGHDFSQVRVHSGAAAAQSARDVGANAYTADHHIVFDSGRLAPGTHGGRRLIAHELTHVVQQSGSDGIRVGQGGERRGLSSVSRSPISHAISQTGAGVIRRDPQTPDDMRRRLEQIRQELSTGSGVRSPEATAKLMAEQRLLELALNEAYVSPKILPPGRPTSRTLDQVRNTKGTPYVRGEAGKVYQAEISGGNPREQETQTVIGVRRHDVRDEPSNGAVMRREVKNYKVFLTDKEGRRYENSVGVTKRIQDEALKDKMWVREGQQIGERRVVQWDFLGAPPNAELKDLLQRCQLGFNYSPSVAQPRNSGAAAGTTATKPTETPGTAGKPPTQAADTDVRVDPKPTAAAPESTPASGSVLTVAPKPSGEEPRVRVDAPPSQQAESAATESPRVRVAEQPAASKSTQVAPRTKLSVLEDGRVVNTDDLIGVIGKKESNPGGASPQAARKTMTAPRTQPTPTTGSSPSTANTASPVGSSAQHASTPPRASTASPEPKVEPKVTTVAPKSTAWSGSTPTEAAKPLASKPSQDATPKALAPQTPAAATAAVSKSPGQVDPAAAAAKPVANPVRPVVQAATPFGAREDRALGTSGASTTSANVNAVRTKQKMTTGVPSQLPPGSSGPSVRGEAMAGGILLALDAIHALLDHFAAEKQRDAANAAWEREWVEIQEVISKTGKGVFVYFEYTRYGESAVLAFEGIHWDSSGTDSGPPGSVRGAGQHSSFSRFYIPPTQQQAAVTDETALEFRRQQLRDTQKIYQESAERMSKEIWLGRWLRDRAGSHMDPRLAYDAKEQIKSAGDAIKQKRFGDATRSMDLAEKALDEMSLQFKAYMGPAQK